MKNREVQVPRTAWALLAIVAAVVVPLRVAEIAQQQETPIFKPEKCTDTVLAPLQGTSKP